MLFHRAENMKVTRGGELPHCLTNSSLVAAIWLGVFWTYTVQPWHGTTLLLFFCFSVETAWWSQFPKCWGSARGCFIVVPFAKPRNQWWSQCWARAIQIAVLPNCHAGCTALIGLHLALILVFPVLKHCAVFCST